MPILYESETGKTLVAHLAKGVTPELAANIMGLESGTWREITDEEAVELQQPTPEEIAAEEADRQKAEALAQQQAEAQEFLFGLMEGLGYESGT